jgi:hypothetical protein
LRYPYEFSGQRQRIGIARAGARNRLITCTWIAASSAETGSSAISVALCQPCRGADQFLFAESHQRTNTRPITEVAS